jgi:putative intracellular protease/amidase
VKFAYKTNCLPWRIEDRLKAIGANYVQARALAGVRGSDGNLVTGQQNFPGHETAEKVI